MGDYYEFDYQDEMLLCAFRYCLGRRTYMVNICVENIIKNWNKIGSRLKEILHKEIRQAQSRNQLGDPCDAMDWEKILKLS